MQLTSPIKRNLDVADLPYRDDLEALPDTSTPADGGKGEETVGLYSHKWTVDLDTDNDLFMFWHWRAPLREQRSSHVRYNFHFE